MSELKMQKWIDNTRGRIISRRYTGCLLVMRYTSKGINLNVVTTEILLPGAGWIVLHTRYTNEDTISDSKILATKRFIEEWLTE